MDEVVKEREEKRGKEKRRREMRDGVNMEEARHQMRRREDSDTLERLFSDEGNQGTCYEQRREGEFSEVESSLNPSRDSSREEVSLFWSIRSNLRRETSHLND